MMLREFSKMVNNMISLNVTHTEKKRGKLVFSIFVGCMLMGFIGNSQIIYAEDSTKTDSSEPKQKKKKGKKDKNQTASASSNDVSDPTASTSPGTDSSSATSATAATEGSQTTPSTQSLRSLGASPSSTAPDASSDLNPTTLSGAAASAMSSDSAAIPSSPPPSSPPPSSPSSEDVPAQNPAQLNSSNGSLPQTVVPGNSTNTTNTAAIPDSLLISPQAGDASSKKSCDCSCTVNGQQVKVTSSFTGNGDSPK